MFLTSLVNGELSKGKILAIHHKKDYFLKTQQNCHGNFVPLKILVWDRFFQEKSFRVERFFLKKWTGPENFVPG